MDISGITSQLSNTSPAQGAIGATVLKKAIDTDASTAQALIDSVATPTPSTNLPPNLGQNINTTA